MKTNRYDFTACDGLAEWNDVTGFFDLKEAIAIQKIVKQLPEGAQVAELGTFQGRSSVAIAAVLPTGGHLVCDDYDQEWPGVMQAIHNTGFKGREISPSLWMHRKPA